MCVRAWEDTGILTVRVQLSLRGLGHPGELPGGGDPGLLVLPFQERRRGCQAALVTGLGIEVSFLPFLGTGFWFLAKIGLLKTPTGPPKERQLRRDGGGGGRWTQAQENLTFISFALSAPVTYVERWGTSI